MRHCVYVLISNFNNKFITYVGYTSNIKNRLKLHNSSKGAKFTRGRKWKVIYKKYYISKSIALKNEYKLKIDRNKRNLIKENYIKKIKKNK